MSQSIINETLRQGWAHLRAGQWGQAEALARQVLTQDASQPDALHLWGVVAYQKNQPARAAALFRQAIALRPDWAEAYNDLGNVLQVGGESQAAVGAYRQAIALRPEFAEAYLNLACLLSDLDQWEEGRELFARCMALQPNMPEAYYNLGNAYLDRGLVQEALEAHRRALELRPDLWKSHTTIIHLLHYLPESTPEMIFQEARRWDQKHAKPLRQTWRVHGNDRSTERRLRVGYVTSDFKEHVSARYLDLFLAHHDHANFEIFGYAEVARPDAATERLQKHADHWRFTCDMSDAELAERIRADQIDILVDLNSHTTGHRLQALGHKPAPVQISWLGCPSTTGLSAMDYRLTDSYIDPPGLDDAWYSEKTIRALDSYWCYDPRHPEPAVSDLPALRNGYVTFGSLNKSLKLNEVVLRLWAEILRAVPGSKLMLLGRENKRALEVLAREGLVRERIVFAEQRPWTKYLELYHDIDLGLDPFPYNGHTTNLDSLWMGVPFVTLPGKLAVSRAGSMELTRVGLPELIARDEADYVAIATALAGDLPRLAELRIGLRQRMQGSVLTDNARFTRNVENAYREMWRKWCRGEKLEGGSPKQK